MLISLNWLKDFVSLPAVVDPEVIAGRLKQSTVEVEAVNRVGAGLDGVVVGIITKIDKHPNADKLQLCQVDVGHEIVPVVCGGSNVRLGMKVALGRLGARVRWHGEGEPVELKPANIRGVESRGMICASDEIGLTELFPKKEAKEIIDLTALPTRPGTALAEALHLNDVVFDIDNKSLSHRPDLWGHLGLAREVAALTGKKLNEVKPARIKPGRDFRLQVKVKEPKLCPRYMAVAVSGVAAEPSPEWLAARLRAVGLRPINVIVDITNYVMLELGQPLHAFDAGVLSLRRTRVTEAVKPGLLVRKNRGASGVEIIVRRAERGERLTTLDGKEYELTGDRLLIADARGPLALAGIKGASIGGVTPETKTVIFESANFDAGNIRRASLAFGLRTDSSARFEKGIDPLLPEIALRRAVELTLKLCPDAKVASAVVDERHFTIRRRVIKLSEDLFASKLGAAIPPAEALQILERLGFGVRVEQRRKSRRQAGPTRKKLRQWAVTVPSWRAGKDIAIPEDIAEEVARLYGYDKIPGTLPSMNISPPPQSQLRGLTRLVKNSLAAEAGFTESLNYSFVAPELLARFGTQDEPHLELDNPIAKDQPLLRRSLLPGLLENIEKNSHRYDSVKLFEAGSVFWGEGRGEYAKRGSAEFLPAEPLMIGLVYSEKGVGAPFYTVSAALARVFERLGVKAKIEPDMEPTVYSHPGRAAKLMLGETTVGKVGELHPAVASRLGIDERVAWAEVNLVLVDNELSRPSQPSGASQTSLAQSRTSVSSRTSAPSRTSPDFRGSLRQPVGDYPEVRRDIAFVVDRAVRHDELVAAMLTAHRLITAVELFDVFAGVDIPAGKKSLAYHITYQSPERTLTADEIDAAHGAVAKTLSKNFGAVVREA